MLLRYLHHTPIDVAIRSDFVCCFGNNTVNVDYIHNLPGIAFFGLCQKKKPQKNH